MKLSPRWQVRVCTGALVLLCLGAIRLEFGHISSTLPYPQHVDEPAIAVDAQRMLTTGVLEPKTFNYPSLPKYLAAAGMAAGFLRGSEQADDTTIEEIGNVGFPYYDTEEPMDGARQLFVVLSVLALIATGILAWRVVERPIAIVVAPLLVLVTPLFFFHSWTYLNVDIVGTMFVTMTLVACIRGTRDPSMWQSAVLPGALTGLAIGCKYTLGLAIVPVLVGIWLYVEPGRRLRATALAIASMVVAFLIVVPYSVLDIPRFLDGVAFEMRHYAKGHPGYDDRPGWPQGVFYLRHFASDFGVPGLLVGLLGMLVYVVKDLRRSIVLLSYPAVLARVLWVQRVHFARNVLAVHPILAIFQVIGLISVHAWLLRRAGRSRWAHVAARPAVQHAIAIVLLLLTVPIPHVRQMFRDHTDSRTLAVAWLDKAIANTWTIVVPTELGMDVRPLEASGHHVVVADFEAATTPEAADALLANVEAPSVILVPQWGADPVWPGEKLARALRRVAARWKPIRSFGTEVLQINHANHAPDGNPAFFVAPLNVPDDAFRQWLQWMEQWEQHRKRT